MAVPTENPIRSQFRDHPTIARLRDCWQPPKLRKLLSHRFAVSFRHLFPFQIAQRRLKSDREFWSNANQRSSSLLLGAAACIYAPVIRSGCRLGDCRSMNSRQRLLAAFGEGIPDRTPVCLFISDADLEALELLDIELPSSEAPFTERMEEPAIRHRRK